MFLTRNENNFWITMMTRICCVSHHFLLTCPINILTLWYMVPLHRHRIILKIILTGNEAKGNNQLCQLCVCMGVCACVFATAHVCVNVYFKLQAHSTLPILHLNKWANMCIYIHCKSCLEQTLIHQHGILTQNELLVWPSILGNKTEI